MVDLPPLARFLADPPLRFVDDLLMNICFTMIFVAMGQSGFVLILLSLLCSPRRLGVRGPRLMLSEFVQSSREPGPMVRLMMLALTL